MNFLRDDAEIGCTTCSHIFPSALLVPPWARCFLFIERSDRIYKGDAHACPSFAASSGPCSAPLQLIPRVTRAPLVPPSLFGPLEHLLATLHPDPRAPGASHTKGPFPLSPPAHVLRRRKDNAQASLFPYSSGGSVSHGFNTWTRSLFLPAWFCGPRFYICFFTSVLLSLPPFPPSRLRLGAFLALHDEHLGVAFPLFFRPLPIC